MRDVDSADVNDYLREIAGEEFTAKDFRTWAGTVLAAQALQRVRGRSTSRRAGQAQRRARRSRRSRARLGNTPAVCRKCYVHPAVIDAYLDGTLLRTWSGRVAAAERSPREGFDEREQVVLGLLKYVDERRGRGLISPPRGVGRAA